jgi:hypothetical protein
LVASSKVELSKLAVRLVILSFFNSVLFHRQIC